MIPNLEGALCVGQWWIFDSIDLAEHQEAAELCRMCPVRSTCLDVLQSEPRRSGAPTGTWAGLLVGTCRKPREHGTERGWGQHRHYREPQCQSCRAAHNEHNAQRTAS